MIGQETVNIGAVSEEIILLDIEIDRLEEQAKRLSKKRDDLKALIMQEIVNGSTFKDNSYHNRKLSVATIRRPKPLRSRAELVRALKNSDLRQLVREDYNENTLYGVTSEWVNAAIGKIDDYLVRRAFDANTLIPEPLRDDLSLNAKYEIRVTK